MKKADTGAASEFLKLNDINAMMAGSASQAAGSENTGLLVSTLSNYVCADHQ